MSTPLMEDLDEAAALAAELRRRTAERDELAKIGAALANRLKQTPEVRAIVGELRVIHYFMREGKHAKALTETTDLLRRLDESQ